MTRRKHRLPMSAPMVRAIQREIEQPGTGKTQTRRIVVPQPDWIESSGRWCWPIPKRAQRAGCSTSAVTASREWHEYMPPGCSPYGQPGDLLAFTETWCRFPRSAPDGMGENLYFRADQADLDIAKVRMRQCGVKWTPARFMPYLAIRYTGVVTDVRVERVQDIGDEDAIAEGATQRETGWCMDWSRVGQISRFAGGVHPPGKGQPITERDIALGSPRWAFAEYWETLHGRGAWPRNDWVWVYTFRPIAANVLDVERDPEAYGLEGAA